jgi:hypothetical protein
VSVPPAGKWIPPLDHIEPNFDEFPWNLIEYPPLTLNLGSSVNPTANHINIKDDVKGNHLVDLHAMTTEDFAAIPGELPRFNINPTVIFPNILLEVVPVLHDPQFALVPVSYPFAGRRYTVVPYEYPFGCIHGQLYNSALQELVFLACTGVLDDDGVYLSVELLRSKTLSLEQFRADQNTVVGMTKICEKIKVYGLEDPMMKVDNTGKWLIVAIGSPSTRVTLIVSLVPGSSFGCQYVPEAYVTPMNRHKLPLRFLAQIVQVGDVTWMCTRYFGDLYKVGAERPIPDGAVFNMFRLDHDNDNLRPVCTFSPINTEMNISAAEEWLFETHRMHIPPLLLMQVNTTVNEHAGKKRGWPQEVVLMVVSFLMQMHWSESCQDAHCIPATAADRRTWVDHVYTEVLHAKVRLEL